MVKAQEYSTKLDSFYYDENICSAVLLLRVRNKRTVYSLTIQEVLHDRNILEDLHPIDLCTIGALAKTLTPEQESTGGLVPISDNFVMMKMEPIIEIISRCYSGGDELITLKLKPINKIVTTTVTDLCNNKNLISVLKYQDAVALGCSISEPKLFLQKNILHKKDKYSISICIKNALFLSLLVLSVLLLSKNIFFSAVGYKIEISGEILFLPAIFVIQNILLEKNFYLDVNKIFLSTMLVIVIFLLYFFSVINLPYPANNVTTIAFNDLYHVIVNKPPVFIISLIISNLIIIYTFIFIKKLLKNLNIAIKNIVINCLCVSLFFLFSIIISRLISFKNYEIENFFYSILLVSIISLIASTYNLISYKSKAL